MVTNAATRLRSFEISPSLFRTLAITIRDRALADRRHRRDRAADRLRPRLRVVARLPARASRSRRRTSTPSSSSGTGWSAVIVIVATLITALAAFRRPRAAALGALARRGMFVGHARAGPARRLHRPLRPEPVPRHLALPALGVGSRRGGRAGRRRARSGARNRAVARAAGAPARGIGAAAGCLVLLVTGTVATAAGPHAGRRRRDIHRLWHSRRLSSPTRSGRRSSVSASSSCSATSSRAAPYAPRSALARPRRARPRRRPDPIGAIQYHSHLPWWLVLIHVAIAASVWAGVVALAALFQRPLAALVRT